MVLRKGNSCMSVMMLTIFGTTYTHSSVFSDTPSMLLANVITFVRERIGVDKCPFNFLKIVLDGQISPRRDGDIM